MPFIDIIVQYCTGCLPQKQRSGFWEEGHSFTSLGIKDSLFGHFILLFHRVGCKRCDPFGGHDWWTHRQKLCFWHVLRTARCEQVSNFAKGVFWTHSVFQQNRGLVFANRSFNHAPFQTFTHCATNPLDEWPTVGYVPVPHTCPCGSGKSGRAALCLTQRIAICSNVPQFGVPHRPSH